MDVKYVPTTCPYCGTGCGLNLVVKDGKAVGVSPWHRSPVNDGKLCPKGNFAYEFVHSGDRLTKPLIRKGEELVEAGWDEAYDLIAKSFKKFKPDEVACLSSARVSNEENYLMQKFARTVLRTPHIDNCAHLCIAPTLVGLTGAFGSGAMTQSVADIAQAKSILIIGSNTFEQHPLVGRRIVQAKRNGAKIIYADPRYTPTAKHADLYLPFAPGTDVALLNGFMQHIIRNGWENKEFIGNRTRDFEKLKAAVMQEKNSLASVSKLSGVPEKDLATAAEWMAKSGGNAIIYSLGMNQHTTGVDNVRAIADLQMLTGRVGRPGTGVCALRGPNNLQGACDMGALPDMYPGYQAVTPENRKKMADAWHAEVPEGKAGYSVTDLIGVLADKPGTVKALYIMGENPMLSTPDLHRVEKGLKSLEFLLVQDIFLTETAALAHVVLPAACFAEKDGSVTNTERRVQRWRKAVNPPGEAKPDWQILCELAGKMGAAKQFTYKGTEEIFAEIAKVTPQYAGMSYARLEKPESLHWPCPAADHPGTPILHGEKFATPDGLGVFAPVEWRAPAEVPDKEYPLALTTGQCLWQFHTGTMTRRSEDLEREAPAGWIEIHPEDAAGLGIADGEMVRAVTKRGQIEIPARVTPEIRKGVTFIPVHYAESAANVLTNSAPDPVSKVPEFRAGAVRVEKMAGGQ